MVIKSVIMKKIMFEMIAVIISNAVMVSITFFLSADSFLSNLKRKTASESWREIIGTSIKIVALTISKYPYSPFVKVLVKSGISKRVMNLVEEFPTK